MRSPGSYVSST